MNLAIVKMFSRFRATLAKQRVEDENEDLFFSEFERALRQFDAETIEKATDRVIDTKGRKFWPTPGEVRGLCEEVVAMRNIGTVPQQAETWRKQLPPVPIADYDEATKERWRKAEEFQRAMAEKHGNTDAFLLATRHLRNDSAGGHMVSKRSTMRSLSQVSKNMVGDRE